MRAVNVGITHDDDAPVAQLRHVEVLINPYPNSRNDILDLLIFEDAVKAHALDVQNFTAQGQDSLEVAITTLFRAATGAITLDEVQFAAVSVLLTAIGELAGEGAVEHVFTLDEVAGGTGGFAGAGRGETLV